MDIKRKICDIQTWKKHLFLNISSTNTCPIALPVHCNPQHRIILTVVSATSIPPFQHLRHQGNVCHPVVNPFTQQTLPTVNRIRFFTNILCIESFCPHKTHNRELLFGSTNSKHVTFKPRKNIYFSTYPPPTLVPLLYQYIETHRTEFFWLLSQPLLYLRFNIFVISEIFATQLWTPLHNIHFLSPT
jgi:hypothetical protein